MFLHPLDDWNHHGPALHFREEELSDLLTDGVFERKVVVLACVAVMRGHLLFDEHTYAVAHVADQVLGFFHVHEPA